MVSLTREKKLNTISQSIQDSLFLKTINKDESIKTVPIWLMRQAGRYQKEYREIREKVGFLELCRTPELASQVTVFAVKQLQVDAAIIFADILLVLDAMGLELKFAKDHGPGFDNPIQKPQDVDAIPEIDVRDSLGYVGESIKQSVEELKSVPLIGFAGAPFTVASYAIEGGGSKTFSKVKCFMYQHPDAFYKLMDTLRIATEEYLKMQVEAGASCLQLFDSWVGCLSPYDYQTFVLPHMKKLFDTLSGVAPTIYFGTDTATLLPYMAETKTDVIGVDWRIDLSSAWSKIGYDKCIQGNLDPIILLSDRETIKKNVYRILEQAEGRPGYIFNLGHGIVPKTPVENAQYLVELVKNYNYR